MTSQDNIAKVIVKTRPPISTPGRYPIFSITFAVVFAIAYLFAMKLGWQLFTYYPASGQIMFLNHPPVGPSAGPAMKWFGYVATTGIIALIGGLIVGSIPEQKLQKVWWADLVWIVPVIAILIIGVMVFTVGD